MDVLACATDVQRLVWEIAFPPDNTPHDCDHRLCLRSLRQAPPPWVATTSQAWRATTLYRKPTHHNFDAKLRVRSRHRGAAKYFDAPWYSGKGTPTHEIHLNYAEPERDFVSANQGTADTQDD